MENLEISRNQEHELIMAALFDVIMYIEMNQEIDINSILEGVYGVNIDDIALFPQQILISTVKNYYSMVQHLQSHMTNWKFERRNMVERAILLMSYAHYYYVKDVDKKIIIDIAVKLSKKFLDKDDYKFVNAVLDKVLC